MSILKINQNNIKEIANSAGDIYKIVNIFDISINQKDNENNYKKFLTDFLLLYQQEQIQENKERIIKVDLDNYLEDELEVNYIKNISEYLQYDVTDEEIERYLGINDDKNFPSLPENFEEEFLRNEKNEEFLNDEINELFLMDESKDTIEENDVLIDVNLMFDNIISDYVDSEKNKEYLDFLKKLKQEFNDLNIRFLSLTGLNEKKD